MMQYGNVPGVERPFARLVQGTAPLTTEKMDSGMKLLDDVFALGGTTFDTAHGYGAGECERMVGKWVNSRGVREQVVIIGKGAHPYRGKKRVTPECIDSDIKESLERFGFDHMDLYLLHRDDPDVPVGPLVEVLNEHQQAGHISAFGGSNWTYQRIREANEYAKAHGLTPFVATSPNFSLAEQVQAPWEGCLSISYDEAAKDWYRQQNMPIFAWSSLAGGFFSGRFHRDNLKSFSDYNDTLCVATYCVEKNFERLDRAQQLATETGMTLPQIATAYVLSQPLNLFALVGCQSGAEFKANLEALELKLTPEQLDWLALKSDTVAS